jgi:hypothetical protein
MRSRVQFLISPALLRPSILGVLWIRRARDHAGAGPDSHVYEINTWLWNLADPSLELEGFQLQEQIESAERAGLNLTLKYPSASETRQARKGAAEGI